MWTGAWQLWFFFIFYTLAREPDIAAPITLVLICFHLFNAHVPSIWLVQKYCQES